MEAQNENGKPQWVEHRIENYKAAWIHVHLAHFGIPNSEKKSFFTKKIQTKHKLTAWREVKRQQPD